MPTSLTLRSSATSSFTGQAFDRGVNFDGATAESDIRFVHTKFIGGKASFVRIHALGNFSAKHVKFAQGVKLTSITHTWKSPPPFRVLTFEGEVDFGGAHIVGEAVFSGAVFKKKANFNQAFIEGSLFFCEDPASLLHAATFGGEVDFGYVVVDICADFRKVHFTSECKRVFFQGTKIGVLGWFDFARFDCGEIEADFSYARIGHLVSFIGACFAGDARFIGIDVAGSTYFAGIAFKRKSNFNQARIAQYADFGPYSETPDGSTPRHAIFEGEASFIGIFIGATATFQGAEFKANLSFNSAKIGQCAIFRAEPEQKVPAASFAGEVNFIAAEIGLDADFNGAEFKAKLTFNSAKIGRYALFRAEPEQKVPATFAGEVDFIGAEIGLDADFKGAQFTAADKPVSFASAKIGGDALFQGAEFKADLSFNSAKIGQYAFFRAEREQKVPAATFAGEVDFIGAEIGVDADFKGAQFTAADKPVSFASAKIGGDASFQGATFKHSVKFVAVRIGGSASFGPGSGLPASTFEGGATFSRAVITSYAYFDGAQFISDTRVSFDGAEIGGDALFRGTSFAGPVTFTGAKISGNASFHGAVFQKEAGFNSAKIGGNAFFRENSDLNLPAATFRGEADFNAIQISGPAQFNGAKFGSKTSFVSAAFAGEVNFSPPEWAVSQRQFESGVDLRGM